MVRPVKIDVTDRLIRFDCIGGGVYIHRHLLTARSDEWVSLLEDTEQEVDASLSSMDGGWRLPKGAKRRWELYIGFLYRNPIWTRSEGHSIEDDFLHLALIWDDCRFNGKDPDAVDAAMDALREIVTQHADALSNPFKLLRKADLIEDFEEPIRFIHDFMVYGRSAGVFGKWYDASSAILDSCIDQELSERYAEKAALKRNGEVIPDIMERCRYHNHGLDDDDCYLDM